MKEFWNERYGEEQYAYGTEANDFLKQNLSQLPAGGDILCLGDGEGRNSVFLASHGFNVTAVDYSEKGLEKTARLASKRGVQVHRVLMDIEQFDWQPLAWDGIVNIFCHLPAPLRQWVHGQMQYTLKNAGVYLLEAYTPEQLQLKTGGPPTAELMMELEAVLRELQPLQTVKAEQLQRRISEGRYHHGLSSVIQVIARRG